MSEIPPISNIKRQMELQRQDRSRKRPSNAYDMGEDSVVTSLSFSLIQEQVDKLMDMDDVRPGMVELGRKLASSKDFPTNESLDMLAEALIDSFDGFEALGEEDIAH